MAKPTLIFLPGKPQGQRSLMGYSLRGGKRVGHDLVTKQQALSTSQALGLGLQSEPQLTHKKTKAPATNMSQATQGQS